jgi:hypothetical protein
MTLPPHYHTTPQHHCRFVTDDNDTDTDTDTDTVIIISKIVFEFDLPSRCIINCD